MNALRALARFLRAVNSTIAVLVFLVFMYVSITAILPPPVTPIMLMRVFEGIIDGRPVGINKTWVPYEHMSPHVFRAILAAEDARFLRHDGIDWKALEEARRYNRMHQGRKLRGASTISMQTAKNVFLWHGRNYVRKGLEAWYTFLIERMWGKKRILEVYANVVEMGPGIYGIEAAAREYFGKSTSALTRREAALIAAVLPNPRRWSPAGPTAYINRRADWILRRMGGIRIPDGDRLLLTSAPELR
ncbi:MAG: monofunctional biosynthetic peptidoglycan transglycosylase [Bacteroidetes bacterium]|nr:monofunctional biosynthetic peptidoglycan transglycosylase [Bacteroidota bacterium]